MIMYIPHHFMCLPNVHNKPMLTAFKTSLGSILCRKKLSAKTRELLKEEHLGIFGSDIRQTIFHQRMCPISTYIKKL